MKSRLRINALANRLERYIALSPMERVAIDASEGRDFKLPAGETLVEEGAPAGSLFILHTGWLHASRRLPDQGRQILRFHFPGDLMGTCSIAWEHMVSTHVAVTDCVVSEVPKAMLGNLFHDQPRLAGLLYAMAAAENVALSDRLASIGRMDGTARLAFLFLDMLARLRATAGGVIDAFDLPLTQADLGDATGMTKVHVSRLLGRMEEDGLIRRGGRRLHVCDEAKLVELTGFVDRYAEIATGWLASSAA